MIRLKRDISQIDRPKYIDGEKSMRKVILYIAMSIDGYIADENGGVDWLVGDGSDKDNQGSFPRFIETVDIVILGYKTYHQIVTELSPDSWAYPGKKSYVLTHKKLDSTDEIIFTDEDLSDLINRLKLEDGKDIWICGGASIVNQLIDLDLIDKVCVSLIPTLLGKGISLFTKHKKEMPLKLISTQINNGITDLLYERRSPK